MTSTMFHRQLLMVALVIMVAALGCSKKSSNPTSSNTGGTHFNSGNMAGNGAVFSVVFTKVEAVPYHCAYHVDMTGVINVSAASSTPVLHNISMVSLTFSPSSLEVHVNDTVKWTNGSGSPHTVTSDN